MASCVIFGGSGYIGTHLAKRFVDNKRFEHIYVADIRKSPLEDHPQVTFIHCDVRNNIDDATLLSANPEWVFNFAAIHREPGHQPEEYFETNLKGAYSVCNYLEQTDCKNVVFTSSISVYGPTTGPTDETKFPNPITAYGGSKFPSELIHQKWQVRQSGRRLLVVRPGVVYGPGDPGNIMRMIQAIRKGYFMFPGAKSIYKSYAYIFGLLDSFEFLMDKKDLDFFTYNYVETPTETIGDVAGIVKKMFKSSAPIISLPNSLLRFAASIFQAILGPKNPIHPVRVKKAGTSTHIIPKNLKDIGFEFKYDFETSINDWMKVKPDDFS